MALWDKLREELDRAGRVAQDAIGEGRVRLDAFRARQLADRAAQALGYAVHRARQRGQEVDSETFARLSSTLGAREAEAARHEARLADMAAARQRGSGRGSEQTVPFRGGAEGGTSGTPSNGSTTSSSG
jgi:hypothetical protein